MAEYAVVNKTQLDADMTSVADTIRTKGGTTEQLAWPDGYNAAIEAIQTGGGAPVVEAVEKDVNFYDYDGFRLYSYTLADALALTELPPLPSREGLICQGWNWTLDDLLEWAYPADIGATYTTDDGKTRIYIELTSLLNMPMTLYFTQAVSNGVEIDWGDGTTAQTIEGSGNVSLEHSYSAIGNYVVTMKAVSGTYSFNNGKIFGDNYARMNTIQRIDTGDGLTLLGEYALDTARSLSTVTLSNNLTQLGHYSFRNAGLRAVTMPKSASGNHFAYCGYQGCSALVVVSAPYYRANGNGAANYGCFQECTSLRRLVSGKKACNTLHTYEFNECYALEVLVFKPSNTFSQFSIGTVRNCYSLQEFDVPATTTTIFQNAFYRCYSMKRLRFLPTTPPTVSNANAFTDLPTDCIIEIPAGSLETYTTATNYPSADTYTYVEVDV